MLSFTDLARDPRVNRQIRWLQPHHQVTACGLANPQTGARFLQVEFAAKGVFYKAIRVARLLLGGFEQAYWSQPIVQQTLQRCQQQHFDLVVANDIDALPVALRVAQSSGAKVLYDAHEYAPKEFEDLWRWRLLYQRYKTYLSRRYIPQASGFITVSPGVARAYFELCKVQAELVYSAPNFANLQPVMRQEHEPIRLVHHGGAMPSRHLETMIEAVLQLDERFSLDFYLMPNVPTYFEQLKNMAQGHSRIRFLDPVPMQTLPQTLSQYDLGIYVLAPVSYNNTYALPNKFFEFVQGRLGLVIGPSPDMAALANEWGFAAVSPDFTAASFANTLRSLNHARINQLKQASHRAAQVLSAEEQGKKFVTQVARLLQ